jgi:hypothetical protein
MHRYKVFRWDGILVVGRYGSRRVIPVWTLEQAFYVIEQIQCGVAFCDFESLATRFMSSPLVPSHTQLRLRAGVAS